MPKIYSDNNWINFYIPIALYGVSFLLDFWLLSIFVFLTSLIVIKKEFLLVFYLSASFFNIMNLDGIPFFGSLVTTYLASLIILAKHFKISKKPGLTLVLTLTGVLVIAINFICFSLDEFYIKTAIKSTLQLIYVLVFISILTVLAKEELRKGIEVVNLVFHKFLSFFLIIAFVFAFNDRLDGFSGAQCLAFQLAIVNLYYFDKDISKYYKILFFVFLALTGSRTYMFLTIGILMLKQLKKISFKLKVILFSSIPIILTTTYFTLPLLSDRYDFTSKLFWGTFNGRFHNYYVAFDLIGNKPFFGNGMGSMILSLKSFAESRPTYIPLQELYQGVLKGGETNIMHNEYLRILTELGVFGFLFCLCGVIINFKKLKENKYRDILFLFLIGALIENLLTLYSTGIITFLIFSVIRVQQSKHLSDAKI
ncbi:MAG: O-antigen ligase family protein [Flavobacteriaceae bacterium]|nr:O-antigen ligase family protein [Flavobacteriaceae bacterium]